MLQGRQLPSARHTALICEEVAGECVVYDQLNHKAHHLNNSLTWIWRKCDGKTSVDSIAAAVEQEFGASDGSQVVFSALKQLEDCELLETPVDVTQFASEAAQVTRRAVVAGGSIVMPAVVSILAPTAADAKSASPPNPPKPPKSKPPKSKPPTPPKAKPLNSGKGNVFR